MGQSVLDCKTSMIHLYASYLLYWKQLRLIKTQHGTQYI